MKVRRLRVKNYRTLEDIDLQFHDYYTALCGKNNAGKTAIMRAIRLVIGAEDRYAYESPYDLTHHRDCTAWQIEGDVRPVLTIQIALSLDQQRDRAITEFLKRFAPESTVGSSLEEPVDVDVTLTAGPKDEEPNYRVVIAGSSLDEYGSQEVVRRLRSARCSVFHNSASRSRWSYEVPVIRDLIATLTEDHAERLRTKQQAFVNEMTKATEPTKRELNELLGRLSDKYEVSLSIPRYTFEDVPMFIRLSEAGVAIPLDEWGSGTRNRTLILQNLFDAKRSASSKKVSDRVAPVVLIEEPESFLHPSAQAEFGNVIQDLANEFQVQVIVTTHSPYMLTTMAAAGNILLSRKIQSRSGKRGYRKVLGTEVVASTDEDWRRPFEHTLGVSGPEFEFVKTLVFSQAKEMIWVEGIGDQEYFEHLMALNHPDRLILKGEIHPYGGVDSVGTTAFFSTFLTGTVP